MDLMAAIKSTIIIDGFIVSIDMTNFVLLGGTVKVAFIMSSNLLLDACLPQLLQCLIELMVPSLFCNW